MMIRRYRSVAVWMMLAASAAGASAQERTRDEVRAELAQAMRNGDMQAGGELGMTQRQLRPDLYPSTPVAGLTREQVKQELAQAQRNGELFAGGDAGLREKDLNPGLYPADPVVAGRSREEVKAELARAIRDGDVLAGGELGMTEYQLHPQYYAAQRAADEAASRAAQQKVPPSALVAR